MCLQGSKLMSMILCCVFLGLSSFVSIAWSQTLPEIARAQGSARQVVSVEYPDMSIEQLTFGADLVVQAHILGGKSALSHDETKVYTDYNLRPKHVFKDSPAMPKAARPGVLPTIMVRHSSGSVIVEGRELSTWNRAFPAAGFKPGEEFILFLKFDSVESRFIFYNGPQGVLRVEGGKVATLSAHRPRHGGSVGLPIDVIVGQIQASIGPNRQVRPY